MTDIGDIGKKLIKKINERTPHAAEVFLMKSSHTSVSVLDQRIEEVKEAEELGLSIRIIGGHKMGFAYTGDTSDDAIDRCIAHAIENHGHNAIDPYWDIASQHTFPDVKKLDIFDPALATLSLKDKIERAMALEKAARGYDPRITRTEHASYVDSVTSTFLCNSEGVEAGYQSSYCGGMADVIAELNKTMESGNGMWFGIHSGMFDPHHIGQQAGEQACQLLGATLPPTAIMDVVFSPEVGISFLSVLSELFLSSAIQKGRSLLANKKGQVIASPQVTLIDNGLMPGLIGTSPCDGEGTPCQKTVVVVKGTLQEYLYSIYTANKEKRSSTGNAHRGSAYSLPDVQLSNFYIEPGQLSQADIIKKLDTGIYITKVMGMHTADPVSGDFSIGIAGLMIRNGKLDMPIRGGAIAGNLLTLLHSISTIGSDLRFLPFHGNIGAPTLQIKDLSISGK